MSPVLTPAPRPGQIWNLLDLADRGIDFATLVGTYDQEQPLQPSPPPTLANMSLHFWRLDPGDVDTQEPHHEDEAYYIIRGKGKITVGETVQDVETGDLVFVPRCQWHRFHDFDEEGLTILILFSPDFTGGAPWPIA